jgi:uncharacterized membrane protein YjjP (DUF1212 family)
MLKCGAEIRRIEETIERICKAYGAEHVEVFSITSLIIASVRMPDGEYSSQTRRVYTTANQFGLLEAYNQLSREICASKPNLDDIQTRIREIKARRNERRLYAIFGAILAASGFTIFFGGNSVDAIVAGVIGLIITLLGDTLLKNAGSFSSTLTMSVLSGLMAEALTLTPLPINVDKIMIGTIMLLIPGLAFGNALRDLLCGDILAGILKTVQSCLTAVLIAFGFLLATILMGEFGLTRASEPVEAALPVLLVMAVLETAAFGLLFRVRLRYLPVVGVCGFFTCLIFEAAIGGGMMPFLAAFIASVFNGLYAAISARVFRAPALIFSSLGAISIVPGSGLYYTMTALLSGESEKMGMTFGQTLLISSGLALGTVCVSLITTAIFRALHHRTEKRQQNTP